MNNQKILSLLLDICGVRKRHAISAWKKMPKEIHRKIYDKDVTLAHLFKIITNNDFKDELESMKICDGFELSLRSEMERIRDMRISAKERDILIGQIFTVIDLSVIVMEYNIIKFRGV